MDQDVKNHLEIEIMKKDIKFIIDKLSIVASLKDTMILIQDEVKGNKKFKEEFTLKVKELIHQELTNNKNVKALHSVSDERIKAFIESSDFSDIIYKLAEVKIEVEVNDKESKIYKSMVDIISLWAMKRERIVVAKVIGYILGSLGLIFAIYKYSIGG